MRKLSLALLLILCLCGCQRDRYIAIRGYAQGGTYTVKLNLSGVREKPAVIRERIDSILQDLDQSLSGYNKGSLLSRFNRGERIVPNDYFLEVYALSRAVWAESDGAFDPAAAEDTIGTGTVSDGVTGSATSSGAWTRLGTVPACALAGPGVAVRPAASASGHFALYVAGGELKPGVRSPKLFSLAW